MHVIKNKDDVSVVPIWINGQAQALDPSRFIEVRSSLQNNKVIHLAQGSDSATATAAVDTAFEAFQSWKTSSHILRRNILLKAAEIYERRRDEAVKRQVEETSCAELWARFNVDLACRSMRETAGSLTTALTGNIPPLADDGMGFVFKEPVGPVLSIQPWNGALVLSTRGVSAALAAGCTVVLKASELCPLTHMFILEAFEEAGLPSGCLNMLQAARKDGAEITETLISHPGIRKVEFVGSSGIGRLIGQTCAKYLKPILMELGGKAPAIILADANLAKAAELCAFGAFLHHGQICMSTERIIVERSVAKEFSELLKDVVSKNYKDKQVFNAVTTGGAEHAKKLLDEAKSKGANFLVGDNTFINGGSTSLQPTIIENINPSDEMWDEETFGPSATLHIVENADEAVKLANSSAYGLNAAVHTRDMYRALQIARTLDYGQVHINSPTTYDQETLSISGSKGSGWGSNNSTYGISEFLVNKTVTLHDADHSAISFGTH